MKIPISQITADPEIQLKSRGIDNNTVRSYIEAMDSGAEFEPVVIYDDGNTKWLADGFHRHSAAIFLGNGGIFADVRQGTYKDALIFAAMANVENGRPMSRAQKQEAGERLLKLTDFGNSEIGRRLAVEATTVMRWRQKLSCANAQDSPRTVTRNGKAYQMDTSNIGNPKATKVDTPELPDFVPTPEETRLKAKKQKRDEAEYNEWYTPAEYIEATRATLGTIALDPASHPIPNKVIQADTIFTKEDDGLSIPWFGTVWLNPPYGGIAHKFIAKLISEYKAGLIEAAITLVNSNATETNWFQPLWDYTLCFTNHRINFYGLNRNNGGSTHGNVFIYLGKNTKTFIQNFNQFGVIVQRVDK